MTDNHLRLHISNTPSNEWDENLLQLDGNIYHSSEWAETCNGNFQHPHYFHWTEGNKLSGLAIGIQRWSHYPIVGRYIKHLSLESYPAVRDNDHRLVAAVLNQLLEYSKKEGYLSLEVNSFFADFEVDNIDHQGFKSDNRIEFSVDLSMTDEQLFKNMATRHKRKVKKARKHNLLLREAETMEAVREFRKLQIDSRERRIRRGESIGMLDDAYYEKLARDYFEKKLGKIFLLTHENEAVSTAFVTMYAGKAYYTYGGSSDLGFKMDAPPLLFSKIFSRCRELGCHEFNMGGVPADSTDKDKKSHGLYMFKAGFGGREILCRSLQANSLQPGISRITRLISKLRRTP